MSLLRSLIVLVCVVSVVSPVWAQDAAAGKKAEPVLDHIPAGAMGFVVINNVNATLRRSSELLKAAGGPEADALVGLFAENFGLSETFAFPGNCGMAAVMLDPKKFGIDLLGLLDPTEEPPEGLQLPMVLLMPARDARNARTFASLPAEKAGKYTRVTLPFGPMFATERGSYMLLSPNAKALDAVLAAKRKAASELSAEQRRVIARSDVAFHIDMRLAGPILNMILTVAEQFLAAKSETPSSMMPTSMGMFRNIVSQLETFTVAGRFVEGAVVLDNIAGFRADSLYGRAMLASKPAGGARLDSLPDLQHAFAAGAVGQTDKESVKLAGNMVDLALQGKLFKDVPQELKDRLRKVNVRLAAEVTGVQAVLGRAPEGSGLFGLAIVVKCRNAEKVKELLAERVELAQAMVKHLPEAAMTIRKDVTGPASAVSFRGLRDFRKLSIRYLKGMETVGPVAADAIVIEHPNREKMKESERNDMKKVIGEDRIRFLVAAPDRSTVVMTFGGSRSFLVEALKASSGGGKIGTSPEAVKARKYLPKKPILLLLVRAEHLQGLIVAVKKVLEPAAELSPVKITCKTPVAVGAAVTGSSAHTAVYVPTRLIKEVVALMRAGKKQEGATEPVRGADDL